MSIPLFVAAVLLDLGLLVAYVRKFVITGLARKRRQAERPAAAEPVLVTRREAA